MDKDGWIGGAGGIARVVEQMASDGGNGEVGDKKRTDERDGQGKQRCEKYQYKKKMNKCAGRGKVGGGLERFGVKRMARKLCRGCRNIRFSSAGGVRGGLSAQQIKLPRGEILERSIMHKHTLPYTQQYAPGDSHQTQRKSLSFSASKLTP